MNEYVNAIYNQRNPNALKELLEKKKKDLDEALLTVITDMDMATDEKVKLGEMLLIAGANPNICTQKWQPILNWIVDQGLIELVDLLLKFNVKLDNKDEFHRTPLHIATLRAQPSFSGKDPQIAGKQPQIIEKLLAAGMDPNVKDEHGFTPLFNVLLWKDVELLKIFAARSDMIHTNYNGGTALHLLTEQFKEEYDDDRTGFVDCLDIVIAGGCDVNSRNFEGETPLTKLVGHFLRPYDFEDRLEVCRTLISAGADVDQACANGKTALSNAIRNEDLSLVKLLLLESNCQINITEVYDVFICDLMVTCLSKDEVQLGVYMFEDACQDEESRKRFRDLSHQPKITFEGRRLGLWEKPLSLTRLSRFAIRLSLPSGKNFLSALEGLPLPTPLKKYVAVQ